MIASEAVIWKTIVSVAAAFGQEIGNLALLPHSVR
jgi:hypothetical protein